MFEEISLIILREIFKRIHNKIQRELPAGIFGRISEAIIGGSSVVPGLIHGGISQKFFGRVSTIILEEVTEAEVNTGAISK